MDRIYATTLHEALHAKFLYLYQRDGFVAVTVPGFSTPIIIRDPSEDLQHERMATGEISLIEKELIAFNPRLGNKYLDTGKTIAYLLAWGGLMDTKAFDSLDGGIKDAIEDMDNYAACRATSDEISSFGFKICD